MALERENSITKPTRKEGAMPQPGVEDGSTLRQDEVQVRSRVWNQGCQSSCVVGRSPNHRRYELYCHCVVSACVNAHLVRGSVTIQGFGLNFLVSFLSMISHHLPLASFCLSFKYGFQLKQCQSTCYNWQCVPICVM